MKSVRVPGMWVLAICTLIITPLAVYSVSASTFSLQQDQSKEKEIQVSEDERKALEKVNAAPSADAKLKAGSDYLKKYSKSPLRPRVAGNVADSIIALKDITQKISLAQNYQSVFNQPSETDMIKPALIEAYLNAGKTDEALNESAKYLERNPDDVIMLTQLAWAGANQAQKQSASPKLLEASSKAATKGIELMEADKKPERMTADEWNKYRNSWLPRLYQADGVIMFYSNNKAAAKEKLEKAAGFDPYDPPTLILLVNLSNDEYQELAKRYQTEKKPDVLNKALAKIDEVIDWMARAVAATDGNAQYKQTNDELRENLKQYYSFRHD